MIKLLGLLLIFSLIQNNLFSQSKQEKVHLDFLSLMDSDDKTPIYYQIIQDRDWLEILSDSLKVSNLLRGGCRVKDIQEVFEAFDFEIFLDQEELNSNLEKWEKKKLPCLQVINKVPKDGNYVQYSVPIFSDEWATIRKQYFEDKKLLEDSIIVYQREKEKWNQVCLLLLSVNFPHYTN
jgi:hypothetical protein